MAYGWGWTIDNLVIRSDLTDTTKDQIVPNDFFLYQNYPNPFNPATKIKYSVPGESVVSIKVFNAIGKKVATVVDGKHSQGNYEVNFNGSNLSSGVYYYTLNAKGYSNTKKMLIIK